MIAILGYYIFALNKRSLSFYFGDAFIDDTPFSLFTLLASLFFLLVKFVIPLLALNVYYTLFWIADIALGNKQNLMPGGYRRNLFLIATVLMLIFLAAISLIVFLFEMV